MKILLPFLCFMLLVYSCESKSKKDLRLSHTVVSEVSGPVDIVPSRAADRDNEVIIAGGIDNVSRAEGQKFLVYKVIDGDTFWMLDESNMEKIKVRLIGIDAPETRNTARKKKGYYAQESKQLMQSLVGNKYVTIENDVQLLDRYQRHLAYVYNEDGIFVNAHMIEKGCAVVSTFPPNVKYAESFYLLQKKARDQQAGLWN